MTGGQYNRAWRIHEVMSEALERLLLKRFLNEMNPDISAELADVASEEADSITIHSLMCGESLYEQYKAYQDRVRKGYLGKTAQFWLIYMDAMRNQSQYHTSVQENNFELGLASIEFYSLLSLLQHAELCNICIIGVRWDLCVLFAQTAVKYQDCKFV